MDEVELKQVIPMRELTTQQLQDAFANFLRLDIGSGDVAADTVKTYLSQIKQYLTWCFEQEVNPACVSRTEIKEYRRFLVEEKEYKPSTISLKLTTVKRFYDAALEYGLIPTNPVLGVKAPRDKKDPAEKINYLESSELKTLLHSLVDDGSVKAKRDRLLIAIMALEGTRTIEMHRASIGDLVQQGDNIGIRVEGKRSIRVVPLTPYLTDLLKDYLQTRKNQGEVLLGERPLFMAVGNRAGGKRLSRVSIRRIVDKYLYATNLKHRPGRTISAHSLRHTAGTLALRNGADLRQVQDLLGHADPRTTSIYAHVNDRWQHNPALLIDLS